MFRIGVASPDGSWQGPDRPADPDDRTISQAEVPGARRDRAFVWLRRLAGMCLSSAGAIHLILAPAHFQEQTLYGVFFLAAAAFQLAVAQLLVLAPGSAVYRAGLYGSVALIAAWIVTRVVAPPLAQSAEPVTLWGVLAKGFELTACSCSCFFHRRRRR